MLVEGYDNEDGKEPIIDCLTNLVTRDSINPSQLKIASYQLTFSSTKTTHNHLRSIYNQFYKTYATETEHPNTFEHAMVASQAFVKDLEKSKLYSKIRMVIMPSLPQYPHGIKLHFDIEDKFPYFLSASNEYDSQGAQLKLKFGNKNFLGYHDQFAFEFDKNLSTSKSNWSFNWSIKDLEETTYALGFKKSSMQQQQGIDENISEINCSLSTEKAFLQFSNQYRSNRIENDGTLLGEYLFQRYVQNLDFIPNKASILTYSRTLSSNMGTFDGIKQGSTHKFNISGGVPYFSMNPFIKLWMSHQLSIPLFEHRKKIKSIKKLIGNSSLECSFNYGVSYGKKHLNVNDTFQNIQYRGYNSIVSMNNSFDRKCDTFAKADFKFNIHNLDGLKEKNLNLFYYTTLMTVGEPKKLFSNLRGSLGIGIQMPIGVMNLEALVPLLSLKKQFDKEPIFQIRIATDD